MMVDGRWGCGKTRFVKDFFSQNQEYKMVYVSLYGIESINRIEDELFSSMIGVEGVSDTQLKSAGDFVTKVFSAFGDKAEGSALGAAASTIGGVLKSRALRSFSEKTILVFDDLERATLSQSQCLSKINEFVEHRNAKVIILCDESKISKDLDPKYFEYKEKVVLHTNHLERSAEEIATICISMQKSLPSEHTETTRSELLSLIKLFELTNIRTIQHALNCFTEAVTELGNSEYEYKDARVVCNLLLPCLAYAVGYKECSVPIKELEDTAVMDSSNVRIANYMRREKEKEKQHNDSNSILPWDMFYERVLIKTQKDLDLNSIFKLVCKGHLDKQQLLDDMKRWDPIKHKIDNYIINFYPAEKIEESVFKQHIDEALALLDKQNYIFYNTHTLYQFCYKMSWLHEHHAFDHQADFDQKLKAFALKVVTSCLNHTEIHFIDAEGFWKELFDALSEESDKLSDKAKIHTAQSDMILAMKQESREAFNDLPDLNTIFLNVEFADVMLAEMLTMSSTAIRCLSRYLHKRYKTSDIFDLLSPEIDAMLKLEAAFKKHHASESPSLKKFQSSILVKTLSDIAERAIKHREAEHRREFIQEDNS